MLFIKIIIILSSYSLRYRSSLVTFALSLFLSNSFISDQLRAEKEKDKRYKDNLSNLVIKYKDSKDKEDLEEELNILTNENDQLKSELSILNKMLDDIKNDQQEKPKIIMEE